MSWASDEFQTISLGDERLDKRAVLLAERIASNPGGSIPVACHGLAEVTAAYRFINHQSVDFWQIMQPHIDCTLTRMAAQPVVLCIQDTTSLDFNGQDIQGLGPLQYEAQRGLLLHPTYAVTPSREPLGLLDSWHWARDQFEKETQRPEPVSESERWVEGYERIAEISDELPQTRCIYIGDREADMAALMRRAHALKHPADWLVRARHNRVLPDGSKLFESVLRDTPIGQVSFHFRPGRGVKARQVVQQLHVKRVSIKDGEGGTLECTCVIAREQVAGKAIKLIEWCLLTNRLVHDAQEAALLIDWYRARWEIEMYFDVLKNGCRVEALQLRTLPRLEVALALFMIVAWRINRLMRLGRHMPELEASLLFDEDEIVAAFAMNRKKPPGKPPTLNEVVRLVAMAGGFLGRKSDGEPGSKTLWQGMERMASFVEGLQFARGRLDFG